VAVPVDVDLDTYCLDPAAAAAAVTPRTKAIMPVHMAGQIADMDALAKLSADTGIPLIQDAAHAHGAQWQGRKVGELGSVAAFSFQNGKLMTAGEGGAVTFPDAELHEAAFLRHSCGRPRTDRRYFHQTSGSNFRLNEFSASVLRAQLGRLAGQIDTREQRWPVLAEALAAIPGVVPQGRDERCDRNPHYMAMFRAPGFGEERRNALVDALLERGLPAFAAFRAIYRSNGFWETGAPDETVDDIARRCPNTEALSADGIWLHHRTLLGTEEQMREVAAVVADTMAAL
jgi:3-amino-5-hydroxybenzoate synthase